MKVLLSLEWYSPSSGTTGILVCIMFLMSEGIRCRTFATNSAVVVGIAGEELLKMK